MAPRRQPSRRAGLRRLTLLAVLVAGGVAGLLALTHNLPSLHKAVTEFEYPLRHDDIIRQQAAEKAVSPELIAAVIYAESRFVEGRRSPAGAIGLMQVTPETAHDIARRSGGSSFETGDLDNPQLNIAYGTYHLRFLLDHYGDRLLPAIAAYNAGQGNVDRWIADLAERGEELTVDRIPFPETRTYTKRVLQAIEQYRTRYGRELGVKPNGQ